MAKKSKVKKPKSAGSIVEEGRLRFFAAATFTIVASTPFGAFKLFKIMFGKDGSIYLPFPYLDARRGLLAEADPAAEPDPKVLTLRRNGLVVDYDVKFTHHRSGVVHFSKSGQRALLPERKGFPLDGPIGKVFDFQLHWLRGFEMVNRRNRVKDACVQLRFPNRHPSSIRVWGEWLRRKDVASNIADRESTIGPHVTVTRRSDGQTAPALLLAQPKESPLQNHLLMIRAEEIPLATGADSPTAAFLGGWDHHEGAAPKSTKMLVFMYPYLGT